MDEFQFRRAMRAAQAQSDQVKKVLNASSQTSRQLDAWLRQQRRIRDEAFAALQRRLKPQVRSALVESSKDWSRLARLPEDWLARLLAPLPPNWRPLGADDLATASQLMVTEGWSLAWSPPTEVIRALVAAPDSDAREDLLLASEVVILRDLERLLTNGRHNELNELSAATWEALETYRSGYSRAAQALSAAVLTSAVEFVLHIRASRFRDRYLETSSPIDSTDVREFRTVCVLAAVARAFVDSPRHAEPPTRFTRHVTAHRVAAPQYSPANSLTALMLAVSLLVELDGLLRERDDRADQAEAA